MTQNSPRLYNARKVGTMVQGPVYIGRPSEWGNPFEVGRDGTREEVIQKHREWFLDQPELVARARRELRGRDLLCWCAPRRCHGDVILEVANS